MTTKPHGNLKLDDYMIEALSDCISKGNYIHDACSLAGISEPSFYSWVNQAQQDEKNGLDETQSVYLRMLKSIQKAKADNRAQFVAVIKEAAVKDRQWLPAITYLERTDPEHWGRKDRTRIDINETKEITITHVEYNLSGAPGHPLLDIEHQQGEVVEGEVVESIGEEKTSA